MCSLTTAAAAVRTMNIVSPPLQGCQKVVVCFVKRYISSQIRAVLAVADYTIIRFDEIFFSLYIFDLHIL